MSKMPLQSIATLEADNLSRVWANPESNGRSHRYCEGAEQLPFITGSEPTRYAGCNAAGTLLDKLKVWFE